MFIEVWRVASLLRTVSEKTFEDDMVFNFVTQKRNLDKTKQVVMKRTK